MVNIEKMHINILRHTILIFFIIGTFTNAKGEVSNNFENYSPQLTRLLSKAKLEDPEAQYSLALIYEDETSEFRNKKLAHFWYKKAAAQGHMKAQYNLAHTYVSGEGVEKSFEEALKWFKKSSAQGYFAAQNDLGKMYLEGFGTRKDMTKALNLFHASAEKGYSSAQNNLGFMYATGKGVNTNFKEALKWYQKAAEQGVASAQSSLGIMHREGQGVPIDYEEEVRWNLLAAEQGNVVGQYNLSLNYYDGRGVEKNLLEALHWIEEVHEQGAEAYGYIDKRDDVAFSKLKVQRAKTYVGLGKYDLALKDYDEAIVVSPDREEAYLNRGIAYRDLGDFDQSIQDFKKAIEINPLSKLPYWYRSYSYSSIGKYELAINDLEKVLKIDGGFADAMNDIAWIKATANSNHIRDGNAAVELAKTAIRLLPNTPEFLDTLAAAYAESGNFELAIITMERSIEIAETKGVELRGANYRIELYRNGIAYRAKLKK